MKRRISHVTFTLLAVIILASCSAFASGKTDSITDENPLIAAYKAEVAAYEEQYEEIQAKLGISYK